jgi:tripartite-type tricarboxylate transporter receptor subunit TctC
VPCGLLAGPTVLPHIRAGKLVALGVSGSQRSPTLPDVPTLAEAGLSGFDELPFYGIFAPAGTPKAVLDPFQAALAKVLGQPEVRERLTTMGLSVGFMNQAQFAARERAYEAVWSRIIKASGFQPQ